MVFIDFLLLLSKCARATVQHEWTGSTGEYHGLTKNQYETVNENTGGPYPNTIEM